MSKQEVISKLVRVLKQSGELVLSGEGQLCLTASCLSQLGEAFHCIRNDTDFELSFDTLPSPARAVPDDFLFLYDFIQKTQALKIVGDVSGVSSIDVSVFHSLHVLEVKRVNLSIIRGIHRLRQQLLTLTCSHGATSLKEVFELCGGDASGAMVWPNLTTVILRNNKLTELDDSLRLLPVLEVMDLSRNNIYDTDGKLEFLSDLVFLHLGFNLLRTVPSFSLESHTKLRTLILKNNQLEQLYGIHELRGLRELDVSFNCICLHSKLEPIKQLPKLHKLFVQNNPICYHSSHRTLTAAHIHSQAAKQLILDGKPLTSAEQKYCMKATAVQIPRNSTRDDLLTSTALSSYEQSNEFTSSVTQDNEIAVSHLTKKKQRKSRSARKPRRPEISELDSDATTDSAEKLLSSSAPVKHIDTKRKMEHMRSELGSDWLQTLTIQKSMSNKSLSNMRSTNQKEATEDDLYLKENSSNQHPQTSQTSQQQPKEDLPHESPKPQSENTSKTENKPNLPNGEVSPERKCEEPLNDLDSEKTPVFETAPSLTAQDDITTDGCHDDEKAPGYSSPIGANFYSSQHVDVEVDYGTESEPFIVSHKDNVDIQMLVSVSEKFIVEKNLMGIVMETLDLKCLVSMETAEGSEVKLLFDYMKKDRRQRHYVMEDDSYTEAFVSLLEPAVQRRNDNLALLHYQCLKCSATFHKRESKRHRKTANQMPACPSCQGDKIIQLDVHSSSPGDKLYDTAYSSPPIPAIPPMTSSPAHPSRSRTLGTKLNSDSPLNSPANQSTAITTNGRSQRGGSSVSSDILVLDSNSFNSSVHDSDDQSFYSQRTDATIQDSEYASAVENMSERFVDSLSLSDDHTPCGSLNNRTISAMVDSVYENSRTSPQITANYSSTMESDQGISFIATSFHSDVDGLNESVKRVQCGESVKVNDFNDEDEVQFLDFKMNFHACHQIDHRLKLHLIMNVLQDCEDLALVVKCWYVPLTEGQEVEGLLVVSNSHLHILKVINPKSKELSRALDRVVSLRLVDITAVYLGLGMQYFTVLSPEGASCFSFVFKDSTRCRHVFKLFTATVQESSLSSESQLKTISKTEPLSLVSLSRSLRGEGSEEVNTEVINFTLCYLHCGDQQGSQHRSCVSLVVTATHLCVAEQDWCGRLVTERTEYSVGFIVKDKQRVTDLTELEMRKSNQKLLVLWFSDENTGDQTSWVISMETQRELASLVDTVKEVWRAEFGVDLQVS